MSIFLNPKSKWICQPKPQNQNHVNKRLLITENVKITILKCIHASQELAIFERNFLIFENKAGQIA